ncbi:MAG: SMC-Scp complex subunit ScpB [Promethearchaeia archaeon]|nr:MAG: SMC-Scp complex subunit ScpB [Candidatus Lokiarchaeia archaeon]
MEKKPEQKELLEKQDDSDLDEEILSDLEELEDELGESVGNEEISELNNLEIEKDSEMMESKSVTENENTEFMDKDTEAVKDVKTGETLIREILNERSGQETKEISSEKDSLEKKADIAPMSDEEEAYIHLKNVVEGALFVAGRPVSVEELSTKTDIRKRELEKLLDELAMDYLMRPTALEIVHIQDKYSLQIKPEYTPKVKKFASGGLIPDAILKTLTIIALKQPLMKSTLVKLRGSTAYEHVKFLIDRGYVEARKKGRSSELFTTDQFADTFGLSRDVETQKKQLITQLGVQDN